MPIRPSIFGSTVRIRPVRIDPAPLDAPPPCIRSARPPRPSDGRIRASAFDLPALSPVFIMERALPPNVLALPPNAIGLFFITFVSRPRVLVMPFTASPNADLPSNAARTPCRTCLAIAPPPALNIERAILPDTISLIILPIAPNAPKAPNMPNRPPDFLSLRFFSIPFNRLSNWL